MLNSDLTYRVARARIDDLRVEAEHRRVGDSVKARLGRRSSQRTGPAPQVRVRRPRLIRSG
jgi:hypothetical protein